MTIVVAVNEAILLKGTSGSARATIQTTAAMRELPGVEVRGVRPTAERTSSKVRNAFSDARWDLLGAAAAARGADILFSPCNIGRSSRSQKHLLFVYDVMVWESFRLFDPWYAAYARLLIRSSLRQADRILTLSSHSREFLLDLAPSADIHVQVLPGRRIQPPRTRWSEVKHTVLMVGESAPHKNHVSGIEAVNLLRIKSGADIHLQIIGPVGRAEADLQQAVKKVDPLGSWISRKRDPTDDYVDKAYETAWVLLQPSLNEGYGLPMVEAAQRAIPVLHSGTGGMSEVLPYSSVHSTNATAFVSPLEALLAEALWTQASNSVLAEASRFDWHKFRSSLDKHLREVVGIT